MARATAAKLDEDEGKPLVLPPVSVVRCVDYDPERVLERVRECLAPLGGIGAFVAPGQRVLVKPNLLSATPPEAAITTHPSIVAAVVRLVREAGGHPLVADTPGADIPCTPAGLRRVYRASGLLALAETVGFELSWDASGVTVANPEGRLAKRLELIRPAVEADVVIALPKLKTHVLTTLTGATKVLFGTVPGLTKARHHATFAEPDRFGDLLLDIIVRLRPALFVMDAVLALEGNGPGKGGTPRHLGAVLAGTDAVAVDLAACRMVGIDPSDVLPLRAARRRGWWDGDPDAARILGTSFASLAVRDFALPVDGRRGLYRNESMLPFDRLTRPLVMGLLAARPVPRREACTGCGSCARACPAMAIAIREALAVVDDRRCIRCYCCQEVCPAGAVDLRLSWAGSLARRFLRA